VKLLKETFSFQLFNYLKRLKYSQFLKSKYLILILAFIALSCNKGLSPVSADENVASFSGTILFKGDWPKNVTRTYLVVFQDPLVSASDFNVLNLKYLSLEIPYGVSEYDYNSADSSYIQIKAGEYSYIAVAQQTTPELSLERKDWTVVGVYYANDDTAQPGKLIIPQNTLVKNINIVCDFNIPPPQPPGGQ
jgi:hypothetical protein